MVRTLTRAWPLFVFYWTACGGADSGHALLTDAATSRAADVSGDASQPMPGEVSVPASDPGVPDMLDLTVHSAAMGRDVQVRLLLPPSFASQPTRHYPVLYLLIGANEPLGYRAWTVQTHIETLAAAHELLVAMPEGGTAGWYSDWLEQCNPGSMAVDNQPAWETFHTVELPALLKQYYRANDASSIAGVSMGGLGATSYAARHPSAFRAVASYSGALHASTHADIQQLSLVLAGCSNTQAVWGSVTGMPEVWAAHDPFELAAKLTDLPLYVSAGNGMPGPLDAAGAGFDSLEPLAESASRDFSDRVTQLGGTKLVLSYYGPGTHSWPYWSRELERSFALLVGPLSAD